MCLQIKKNRLLRSKKATENPALWGNQGFELTNSAAAYIMAGIITAGHGLNTYGTTGGRRMDELTAAHINAHMADGCAAVGEEHQVAGLQLAPAHFGHLAILRPGGMGQIHAEMLVHIAGKAGAVKAAGRRAAVAIRRADKLFGVCNNSCGACVFLGLSSHDFNIFRADEALNAVVFYLKPTFVDAGDLRHLTLGNLAQHVAFRRRGGANVQGGSGDFSAAAVDVHYLQPVQIGEIDISRIAVSRHISPLAVDAENTYPVPVGQAIDYRRRLRRGAAKIQSGVGCNDAAALDFYGMRDGNHGRGQRGGYHCCFQNLDALVQFYTSWMFGRRFICG